MTPVRVIGHDWGAVAGWCLALEHPQLVRSQVALSVGHPRQYAVAGLEQKLKGLYTLTWQVPGAAERWLAQRGYAGLRGWGRQHPRIDDCVKDLSRPGRLTAGLNWYRANLRRVLFGPWEKCAVPTLGVWSSGDHFLAEDQMRDSHQRMAGALALRAHRTRGTLVAARAAGSRRGPRVAVVRATLAVRH